MRCTIEWLLELPEQERQLMEQAEAVGFTRDSPAPLRQVELSGAKEPPAVILNMGATEATAILCQLGLRPAVLNFAHGYNCGGGFEHSGGSQEEDIFRKSSLFLSLWPHRRGDDGPGVLARGMWIGDFDKALARKAPFYPHTECGGIYSPHVRLVRKLRPPDHPLLAAEEVAAAPAFAVLTVAAQDVGRDGGFEPELLRQKLRTALHLAAAHGHDAVVLGAFGCGYFRNPPDAVAQTCRDLLHGEFAGAFPAKVFAVPDRCGRNLDCFSSRFPQSSADELAAILRDVPRTSSEVPQKQCEPMQL